MLANNGDVSKAIVKRTMTTLKNIVLKPNVKVVFVPTNGLFIETVYTDDVECLIIHYTIASCESLSVSPSLPIGCSALHSKSKNVECSLGRDTTTFTLNILQLSCELALILTGYKMEGQTLHPIIVGSISKYQQNGKSGWIYVILSRIQC